MLVPENKLRFCLYSLKVLRYWPSRKWGSPLLTIKKVRFSAIDHQESVWGRRVTEKDKLGKKDWSSFHHYLSLSWIKVSLPQYHIYYVRIIDSTISKGMFMIVLWNYENEFEIKLSEELRLHLFLLFVVLQMWNFDLYIYLFTSKQIIRLLYKF